MPVSIPRTPEQIQSEINRITANIGVVEKTGLWSNDEKEKLFAIYNLQLEKLKVELAKKTHELAEKTNEMEINQ